VKQPEVRADAKVMHPIMKRRWVDRDVICMSAVYAFFAPPCKRLTLPYRHL